MADEEPVDVMPQIRKDCEPQCAAYNDAYKACLKRVADKGFGDCEGQYLEFLGCIDKCSVPQIMKHLK